MLIGDGNPTCITSSRVAGDREKSGDVEADPAWTSARTSSAMARSSPTSPALAAADSVLGGEMNASGVRPAQPLVEISP